MSATPKDLGPVTAYADAVAHGYKGTREQFGADQAAFAGNAAAAAEAAKTAEKAAQEAKTAAGEARSPQYMDAMFAALLDDTNTTRVFKAWWPVSAAAGITKEQRMTRWFNMLKNDKTYGAVFESPDVSSNTLGAFSDDRAGVPCNLSTDTVQGEDELDEHRAFWWVRVNAEEIDDQGTLNILAHEYEEEFDPTGETAPVMTLQVAPWIKKEKTEAKLTRQLRTKQAEGYHLWAEARNPDGSERAYVAHYTYGGGYDANGYITSGAGKRPIIRTSYTAGLTKIKAGRQFQTGWNDHDQNWLLLMWQLRHGSLEPSGQMEGCLAYNYQYLAAAGEENVKRVLLTAAQAANFHAGCSVSVGETAGGTNADRNATVNYNIADCVRVMSKESVTIDGAELVALNLDVPATFTTTTTTRISTMPWYSGTTDAVLGRGDGSPRNNTNGQNACRCAGIEFGVGCYRIMYGTLYKYTTAADGTTSELQVHACKQQGKEAAIVTADYVDTGVRMLAAKGGWMYIKEMDDTFDNVFFPKEAGGTGAGSSTYLRSAFYNPASKSALCVPWSFGSLNGGGGGGVACVYGNRGPGSANWGGALGLSRRCWRGELTA